MQIDLDLSVGRVSPMGEGGRSPGDAPPPTPVPVEPKDKLSPAPGVSYAFWGQVMVPPNGGGDCKGWGITGGSGGGGGVTMGQWRSPSGPDRHPTLGPRGPARWARHPNQCSGQASRCFTPQNIPPPSGPGYLTPAVSGADDGPATSPLPVWGVPNTENGGGQLGENRGNRYRVRPAR